MSRSSPPALVLTAILVAALAAGVAAQTTTTAAPTGSFTEDGTLTLEAGPNQQIHGTTTLEAGSEVTVRIQSENASDPFLARPTATVDEGGAFTVTQDLSDLSPGTVVTATARHDGTDLAETRGRIVECSGACTATATATETQTATRTDEVVIESGTTVRRGEVARLPISFGDRDSVSLTIGDDTDGFELEATLTDGDEDGRVTVLLGTTSIGRWEQIVRPADDRDRVHIRAERGTDHGIPRGSYDVALAADENAPVIDTETIEVRERAAFATDDPGLHEAVVTVRQGRSAEIPVSVGDRDRVALVIGGQDVSYWLNATLVDADGDGRVVAVLDGWAAGHEARALTAADVDDRVVIDSETTLGDTIAPVEYDMRLYRGGDHDEAVDVGTLSVRRATEPSTTADARVQSIATARRGQSAEILLSVGDRDNASLTIGDDTDSFGLEATVTDGDSDGRVAVRLDTTATDGSGRTIDPVDRQDEVHIHAERGTDDGVPVGSYDVALAADESAPVIDTGTLTVLERSIFANDDPGLAEAVVTVRQDRSTEILVSVGDQNRAALRIGNEDEGYRLDATLVDGDGDGRVVAVFDAGAAGTGESTLVAAGGDDRVSIDSETTPENAIEPDEYDMGLYRPDDDGDVIAVGTLSVREAVATVTADEPATTSETSEPSTITRSETPAVTDTASAQPDTTTGADATSESGPTTTASGPGFGVLGILAAAALIVGSGLVAVNRD